MPGLIVFDVVLRMVILVLGPSLTDSYGTIKVAVGVVQVGPCHVTPMHDCDQGLHNHLQYPNVDREKQDIKHVVIAEVAAVRDEQDGGIDQVRPILGHRGVGRASFAECEPAGCRSGKGGVDVDICAVAGIVPSLMLGFTPPGVVASLRGWEMAYMDSVKE